MRFAVQDFIGTGSIEFTRAPVLDLFTVPEFDDIETAFNYINSNNEMLIAQK